MVTVLFKREGGLFSDGRMLADVNDLVGALNTRILEVKAKDDSKNPEFYRGVIYGLELFRNDLEDASKNAQGKML